MLSLSNTCRKDSHAMRLEIVPDALRHFGSEPLLDLQAVGKAVQHPRKLGDTDHLLVGQIGDRRLAGDRCKMVFAV